MVGRPRGAANVDAIGRRLPNGELIQLTFLIQQMAGCYSSRDVTASLGGYLWDL